MSEKYDVNKINLQIDDVEFFNKGLKIFWSSDMGFGEYMITKEDEELLGKQL